MKSLVIRCILLATVVATPALAQNQAQPSKPDASSSAKDQLREQYAYHIGSLAYVWGYPMVDMSRQLHNETQRIGQARQTYAPLNHFYYWNSLLTPATAGNLRAPNTDTMYFGGWFDLSKDPVIVHAPDTHGRYYTMAVTDFYSEVQHVGRRTTGTAEKYFALVGPGFKGQLPADVHPVLVPTRKVWILGRLLVEGEADLPNVMPLLQQFWAAPLSSWQRGKPPAKPAAVMAPQIDPMNSLDFFVVLNDWLRDNPIAADEGALMGMFDEIGFGPKAEFRRDDLDAATRRGLERAMTDAKLLVRSSKTYPDVRNGWIFPLGLGKYGRDYLTRANVVWGGYANLPEESTYAARVTDSSGKYMTGAQKYHLHLKLDEIPPAGAFWSIAAYDLKTSALIENSQRRYSISDRTQGIRTNPDGSLDIYIQKEQPAEGAGNWLPVGDGAFSLVVRIYEPARSVFDGSYSLPQLQTRP